MTTAIPHGMDCLAGHPHVLAPLLSSNAWSFSTECHTTRHRTPPASATPTGRGPLAPTTRVPTPRPEGRVVRGLMGCKRCSYDLFHWIWTFFDCSCSGIVDFPLLQTEREIREPKAEHFIS
ncbi:hypothetical protein CEXT_315851 [Caerostris extrusa]|uniref:Uncharacterized protein n=1 Tax=Caerostris extrusa TaxID=172846 RepID=A0AAV4NR00_CAEEX|nr:hypothetical protein CEXT_315851 [Caerostris extrusa]